MREEVAAPVLWVLMADILRLFHQILELQVYIFGPVAAAVAEAETLMAQSLTAAMQMH